MVSHQTLLFPPPNIMSIDLMATSTGIMRLLSLLRSLKLSLGAFGPISIIIMIVVLVMTMFCPNTVLVNSEFPLLFLGKVFAHSSKLPYT